MGLSLFGGDAWPLGDQVGFLERPFADVLEASRAWHRQLNWKGRETELPLAPLLDRLLRLAPLEQPPGRQLIVETGGNWTMHADNSRLGGDSVSWVSHLCRVLNCRGVIARHAPGDQDRYPSTQFELLGPAGVPPLMYVRTITAGIYDEDRWHFETRGEVQPFEEVEAYKARRIRSRFDRPMLLRYLQAIGILGDDPSFFRKAVLFESLARPLWTASLAEVRKERAP